jgi:hypothetical protein
MKYEALYAAVLGAAPTVLIAYVLQYRWTTHKPELGHKLVALIIIISTWSSATLSLIALVASRGNSLATAYLVVITLAIGFSGLLGELVESVVRGI